MSHTYEIGTGAWVQDPKDGWVSTTVVEKEVNDDKVKLVFEITSGDRIGEVWPLFSPPRAIGAECADRLPVT